MGHRATGKAGRRDEPEPEDLPRRGFAPQALESEQERGFSRAFYVPVLLGRELFAGMRKTCRALAKVSKALTKEG